ncbi:MAG TPA: BamA/TamA family outer membrane protein [Cyclobacteriaceae bacterium]|nr:BamA/TamA family outer membrane protein [Cyclobacteriaceae bacterium]
MRKIPILIIFFLVVGDLCAQDSLVQKQKEVKVKKGWTFGALPTISFDSDLGFQYGGLVNFYHYGDGSIYPRYRQSIYIEISRTTKGSGINRFYYDSEYLIPKVRLTADVSYLTEQAMQFFGFNGAESVYNSEWEDDSQDSSIYKSRMFYRHDRKIFRIMPTFQGNLLKGNVHWKWITGFAMYNNKIDTVDVERLNKGKNAQNKLPYIEDLYEKYIRWNLISPEEKNGNLITYIKGGIAYDSRDNEANPFKGLWTEAVLSVAPAFLGDWKQTYTKLTLIHRQYFTIRPEVLSFAYRVAYQGTLSGEVPFHMQPHIVPTVLTSATSQGLGGSRTLRGIQRNRVIGDGIIFGNFELRWKFLRTIVFNQNLYLGTNIFFDAGMVVDKIDRDFDNILFKLPETAGDYFSDQKEKLHSSAGLGLKVALNENFILSCDYGRAFDPNDGKSGLYIALNYLY